MAPDDGWLMQAAQSDQDGAFHQLVERYLPRIHRFLTRLVGPAWAEDLTQEVFLRAYERRRTYRPEAGNFSSWIYGIARNLSIDFHRRKRPVISMHPGRGDQEGDGQLQLVDPAAKEPSDRVGADEARAALEAAIGRLDEPYRTTVVLCLLEGFTYEEAAAVEGCPAKTISSRLARGRARLREALADTLDGTLDGAAAARPREETR